MSPSDPRSSGTSPSRRRATALQRLETSLAEGRIAEAETAARVLLADEDGHIQGATGLARCAFARGDLDGALRWADRAARFAPNDVALMAFHAALLIAAGRPAEVPPLLDETAERAATPTAALALGQAWARLGAWDRLVPLIGRLLGRFPVSVAPMLSELADHALRSGAVPGWAAADEGLRIAGALRRPAGRAPGILRIDSRHAPVHSVAVADLPAGDDGLVHFIIPLDPASLDPAILERGAEALSLTLDGAELLGSPLQPLRHAPVEGSVVLETAPAGAGRLSGWAWCPGDPPRSVTIRAADADGRNVTVPADRPLSGRDAHAFGAEEGNYGFVLDLEGSGLTPGLLRVTALSKAGLGETPLAGSPLPWPGPRGAARVPVPVLPPPARPTSHPVWPPRPASGIVDVIVPVYRGRADTLACLRSVLGSAAAHGVPLELVVVEDASPEPELVQDLESLAAAGRITLLRNPRNLGFPGTVNRGLRQHPDRDAVLLNADTLVAGDWLARLRAAAYAAPDVGTVTPLSNDATILSYPSWSSDSKGRRPAPPSPGETARLDRLARTANAGLRVELPTAVGFCAYIRRDCLNETGPFEELLFGRGYGEENDFCLRARRLGWRHLGAADVFVAHVGGRSFGRQTAILTARNGRLLETLHPGYDALVQDFIADDPLMAARRRLDLARWVEEEPGSPRPAVLLITLGGRGGVTRFVEERAAALRAEGWRVLRLAPDAPDADEDEDEDEDAADADQDEATRGDRRRARRRARAEREAADPPERRCRLSITDRPDLRDLAFRTAAEFEELVAVLRRAGTAAVEIHHLLGHDPRVLDLPARLGAPYDLTIHDYGLICPRVNLVDGDGRYCGEPDLAACERCVADPADRAEPALTVDALRRRTRALVAGARRVVAPTRDVAARLLRHVAPRPIEVRPWEEMEPPALPPARPPRTPEGRWRVCVIGAMGVQKGYEVLIACARDAAARDLPLEFVLVGFSEEDPPLFATGRVHVTGRFAEEESVDLVRRQGAHLAFLPSISPETWCYALSTAWRAGLEAVAFDIGALGERIRAAGGALLPPSLDPTSINDALLGLLDAPTPHGVAIDRDSSIRPNVGAQPPRAEPDVSREHHTLSNLNASSLNGGSSMIGSTTPAEAAQSSQIKATAQTLALAPGFYSLTVTNGGGATVPGEVPLPSVQLATAPGLPAGATVEMIGTVPGNWLTKTGDTVIIKVAGGSANVILSSYKHVDRPNALLSLQVARIDEGAEATPQITPQTAAPQTAAPQMITPQMGMAPVAPAAPPRPVAPPPKTEILAHVQRQGDMRFPGGNWAGAVGQRLWIEAFAITPVEGLAVEDIEYKGLTANGWETPWITGGNMCGSRGLGTPLIGFSIRLRGTAAERFDCHYEAAFVSGHRSAPGQNGSPCRSDAIGDPLEGILLRIVEKQAAFGQPRPF